MCQCAGVPGVAGDSGPRDDSWSACSCIRLRGEPLAAGRTLAAALGGQAQGRTVAVVAWLESVEVPVGAAVGAEP